jgi:hypothetical protein
MKSAAIESKKFAGGLKRALAFVVAISVVVLFGVFSSGSVSAAPKKTGSVATDITNMLPAGYTGQVVVTDFANQGGTLIANGTATVTNAAGEVGTQAFAVPVTQATDDVVDVAQVAGTCEILNLVLGPLHLDLLGLVIDLNKVVLVITAVQGAGNLLGNLLCAIVGILDGPAPLGAIAGLLDRILRILG